MGLTNRILQLISSIAGTYCNCYDLIMAVGFCMCCYCYACCWSNHPKKQSSPPISNNLYSYRCLWKQLKTTCAATFPHTTAETFPRWRFHRRILHSRSWPFLANENGACSVISRDGVGDAGRVHVEGLFRSSTLSQIGTLSRVPRSEVVGKSWGAASTGAGLLREGLSGWGLRNG